VGSWQLKAKGSKGYRRLYCLLSFSANCQLPTANCPLFLSPALRLCRLALKMTHLGRSGVREFFTSALFVPLKAPQVSAISFMSVS
jgi:hypothetical protein